MPWCGDYFCRSRPDSWLVTPWIHNTNLSLWFCLTCVWWPNNLFLFVLFLLIYSVLQCFICMCALMGWLEEKKIAYAVLSSDFIEVRPWQQDGTEPDGAWAEWCVPPQAEPRARSTKGLAGTKIEHRHTRRPDSNRGITDWRTSTKDRAKLLPKNQTHQHTHTRRTWPKSHQTYTILLQ